MKPPEYLPDYYGPRTKVRERSDVFDVFDVVSPAADVPCPRPGPETLTEGHELWDLLRLTTTTKEQALIRAWFLEGCTLRELGKLSGISGTRTRQLIDRAIERARKRLSHRPLRVWRPPPGRWCELDHSVVDRVRRRFREARYYAQSDLTSLFGFDPTIPCVPTAHWFFNVFHLPELNGAWHLVDSREFGGEDKARENFHRYCRLRPSTGCYVLVLAHGMREVERFPRDFPGPERNTKVPLRRLEEIVGIAQSRVDALGAEYP